MENLRVFLWTGVGFHMICIEPELTITQIIIKFKDTFTVVMWNTNTLRQTTLLWTISILRVLQISLSSVSYRTPKKLASLCWCRLTLMIKRGNYTLQLKRLKRPHQDGKFQLNDTVFMKECGVHLLSLVLLQTLLRGSTSERNFLFYLNQLLINN